MEKENESEIHKDKFVEDVTKILMDMRGEPFDDIATSIWFYIIAYKFK